MLSSQMMFDKPPQRATAPPQRGRRAPARTSRRRADSIPRHGATDPADKYYGSQAKYYGKDILENGHVGETGSNGDAMWDFFDDAAPAITTVNNNHHHAKSTNGGGAFWDIYDDQPSYQGPSYRDLRKKKNDSGHKGDGEAKKGYEMRRSAPIDSPYDMISDHVAAKQQGSASHSVHKVAASSRSGGGDLQSSDVQKTIRPDGGLGFSRWGQRQESSVKPTFLGVEAQWY